MSDTSDSIGEKVDESKMVGVVVRIENGPQVLFVDLNGDSSIGELIQSNRLKNCELYFGDFLVEGAKAEIRKIASIEKNYYLVKAKYTAHTKTNSFQKSKYDPSQKCLISIKGTHGKWLCAESNGKAVCDKSHCGECAHFWSIPSGNNKIGLLSHHQTYLSAQPEGTLEANRYAKLTWEMFTVVRKHNRFGFQSCHGKFLTAQLNGKVEINEDHLSDCELFEVGLINHNVEEKVDIQNKILEDGKYRFIAAHSGKSLDVEEDSMKSHATIVQWDGYNRKNQLFSIRRQKLGYCTVQCVHSGLYWDICGATMQNGGKLIQYGYNGANNQLFKFVYYGDNKWYIKAKHSEKLLDIECDSQKNGTKVIQFDAHYGANQLFFCSFQK